MTAIDRQQRTASWLGLGLMLLGVLLVLVGACVGSTGLDSLLKVWSDPVAMQIV